MKKKLIILLMAIVLVAGCQKVPKLENGKEVVVEIEGKQFTADDLFTELKESYGTSALVNLVDSFITDKEINEDMINDAEEQAQSEFDMYKAYSGDSWNSFLSNYGFNSEEDFKETLVDSYKKSLVLEKYIKENVITEKEINEYYENDIYGEMTVRHILIEPENNDDMTDDEVEKAKEDALEEAKNIIEELKKSEDLENDFIAIAKEKSDDTGSKSEGGLIENFTNESGLVDEFFETSNKLNVGELTNEPVETEFGYHIIYKISQKEKPTLETVKDTILKKLTEEILSDENASYIYWAGLREKYDMKIYDDIINDTYKATMDNLKK